MKKQESKAILSGKQLRKIRKDSGLTSKEFYEKRCGYAYSTVGFSLERFASVPVEGINRLIKSGLWKPQ